MYGEGNYGLTAVKEISVTKSFLGLKEEDKKCQNKGEAEILREILHGIRSRFFTFLHFFEKKILSGNPRNHSISKLAAPFAGSGFTEKDTFGLRNL